MQDAIERLFARRSLGIEPGLDAMRVLMDGLGNPHETYGVIHVAGTNGKGSVCAMIEGVVRAWGIPVGLYTSPHLVRFHERFRVDGGDIDDGEVAEAIREIETQFPAVAAARGREPTFFECATAIAFSHFRRRGVRLAVVETGMGGRLDATNVVQPLLSVITRVEIEHTAYLGTDTATIAGEKAGIIKPGRTVVCGSMDTAASERIRAAAVQHRAALVTAGDAVTVALGDVRPDGQHVRVESREQTYGKIRMPLLGAHQAENLATAVAALEVLGGLVGCPLDRAVLQRGMDLTRWRGRCEVVWEAPPVVLDGAHNPGGAAVLADVLKLLFRGRPLGLVLGMHDDKDAAGFMKAFGGRVKRLWAVPLQDTRVMAPTDIAAAGMRAGWEAEASSLREGLSAACRWADANGGVVCVCGSLYLVGETLALLEQEPGFPGAGRGR